ncbi:MAG: AAA family ATPase [Acidithiobacillus sp.]
MQIERLEISEFRKFRDPLVIDGLQPGINLFVGPNEVGKSTILRALRAVFLERHRSKIDDILPWNAGSASPAVRVHFRWQGEVGYLEKCFPPRKSCVLRLGDQSWEGEAAEERLAEILGFTLSGRGAIRDELLGIPGLLWVEQGKGQEISDAVQASTEHLRSALPDGVHALTSTQGDRVHEAVEAEIALLVTSTGRPRGDYLTLQSDIGAIRDRIQEIRAAIRQYETQVDTLARLQTEDREARRRLPWQALRQQAEACAAQLQQAREVQQQQAVLTGELRFLESQRQQRDRARHRLSNMQQTLAEVHKAAQDCRTEAQERQAEIAALREAEARARAELQQAKELEVQAQEQQRLLQEQHEAARLQETERRQGERLAQARETMDALLRLRAFLAEQVLDESGLRAVRETDRQLHEAQVRLDALSTRLSYRWATGIAVQMGDGELSGEGQIVVAERVTLRIPNVGEMEIAPGQQDLAEVLAERDSAQHRLRLHLANISCAIPAEAEGLWERIRSQREEAARLEQRIGDLAPEGVDALEREIQECRQRRQAIAERSAQSSELPDPLPHPEEAALARQEAEARWESQRRLLQEREGEILRLEERQRGLEQQHAAMSAELQAAEAEVRDLDARSPEIDAQYDRKVRLLGELRSQLAAFDPDLLQTDRERFLRSADALEQAFHARQNQMAALHATLEGQGAQGLESHLAQLEEDLAAKERRFAALDRRLRALMLLRELLLAQREAVLQRLQAPLQARIDHLLRFWSPGARLRLGDALEPSEVQRANENLPEPFTALSFGAREQVALLLRLAYADALKEAGRPTLILLDDALNHSDRERLSAMKRMLADAARRHQIWIMTCHPEDWEDMGVPARSLIG